MRRIRCAPRRGGVVEGEGACAIELHELEQAVTAVEPAAYFLSPRQLRRVIKRDRGLVFLGRYAARPTTYTLTGPALARILAPDDVPRAAARGGWPPVVYLLERPGSDSLTSDSPEVLLTVAWRRLFRLRIQAQLRRQTEQGIIDQAGLEARIAQVGRVEFEEARLVFRQDGWLVYPESDAEAYALFAAHFLELHRFAPALLRVTFPGAEHPDEVAAVLARDLDPEAILVSTQPQGAPPLEARSRIMPRDDEEPVDEPPRDENGSDVLAELADWIDGDTRVAIRARVATERGNFVRAALLWTRAAQEPTAPDVVVSGEDPARTRERAQNAASSLIRRLGERLRVALNQRSSEATVWASALAPLLEPAAEGFWSTEARLLYVLQQVCLDHERDLERLDLVGWILSFGRKPLRRAVPHLREVSISNRLRSALRRLSRTRLDREQRIRLESLLRPAVHHAEEALRERFRPAIQSVLQAEWVPPANVPEHVAHGKLVEELLDRLVDAGHLTLGDLRDSASRSDLKLPDLVGPADLWQGGPLLRADRALGRELDGVHRRGEIYLRILQRFSMVAFGTRVGRWLTRYVALPFGGAYVALEGLQHLIGLFGVHAHLGRAEVVGFVGIFALLAINFPRFRARVFDILGAVGRFARTLLLDVPAWLLDTRILQRILHSQAVAVLWHLGLKPGLAAAAAWLVAQGSELGDLGSIVAAGGVYVSALVALNTRTGRALEESASEALVRGWTGLVHDLIPGVFRLVMSFFQRLLEWVERLFYAVDEWLRFRAGQSRFSLASKAVVGTVWAALVYVARIAVNVLIEPQVNPIKHFPVVTVSHKIILPLTPQFITAFTPVFGPVNAKVVAGTFVMLLPGVFGFLVWELLSNWRLYRANRAARLQPVMVGGHGETVARLLRPGFHSGTLPKVFSRLRRARRRAWMGLERIRSEKDAFKQREALHHVEESIRSFAERDLVALLEETHAFEGSRPPLQLGAIRLATNRFRLEWLAPSGEEPSAWLDLEERNGQLVAGLSELGWLTRLDTHRRRVLDDALAGWFKKSGVNLVQTPGRPVPTAATPVAERPTSPALGPAETVPVDLEARELTWTEWVACWKREQAGESSDGPLAGPTGVLPMALEAWGAAESPSEAARHAS
ncbi:MAG: hypothetical protein U0794_07610 [Isosphaeraceae bacterium]